MNAINNDFNIDALQCVVDYKAKMMILEPEEWQNHHLLVEPNVGTC